MNDSEPAYGKNPALDFERVQILYANVRAGYVGVAAAIVMLYLIGARYASPEAAATWLLIVAICNVPRVSLSILFGLWLKRGRITVDSILPWDRYMFVCSVLAYAAFASSMFLPFGTNAEIGTVLCAFVFMVLATGGVLVLSTSFIHVFIFLTIVLGTIIARMFMFDDQLFLVFGLILAFGYVQLLKFTRRQQRILVENISLKLENEQHSLIDPLTKLWNRRRLALFAEQLVPTSERSGHPFCVIILDIDHFKRFNDTQGHTAGDALLVKVAAALQEGARDQDLVVRYGGEEFLIVQPQTGLADAAASTDRILQTVRDRTGATISAGVAQYERHLNFEAVVALADQALYAAKKSGRDQYMVAEAA